MNNLASKVFGILSQGNSGTTQEALNVYANVGSKSMAEATYIAMGGVLGPLTVLASIIGEPKNGQDNPKNNTTEESLAFAALLVLACCKVHRNGANGADCVAIDTTFTAETTCEALDAFQRIFGKNPDGFVRASMIDAARKVAAEGENAANALLSAICANHKPA